MPYIPDTGGLEKCKKRKDAGKLYEEVIKNRGELGLITSYEPRQHPRYQSAFKLLDMAAKQDSDSETSSQSTEDSSLFTDDEEEEEDEEEFQVMEEEQFAIGGGAKKAKRKQSAEDVAPSVIGNAQAESMAPSAMAQDDEDIDRSVTEKEDKKEKKKDKEKEKAPEKKRSVAFDDAPPALPPTVTRDMEEVR